MSEASSIAELLRRQMEQQQAARQWQGWTGEQIAAQPTLAQQDSLRREIELRQEIYARENLEKNFDHEIDRIASIFFTCLMTRINNEFSHTNPTWDELGAREKQHWLEATRLLLEELKKEPVAKNDLALIAKRRIIQQ